MDKNRAYTEIDNLLNSKEYKNKTWGEQQDSIKKVLEELQSYNYNLGKRHGMFKAVNLLTELVEKEGKTE